MQKKVRQIGKNKLPVLDDYAAIIHGPCYSSKTPVSSVPSIMTWVGCYLPSEGRREAHMAIVENRPPAGIHSPGPRPRGVDAMRCIVSAPDIVSTY